MFPTIEANSLVTDVPLFNLCFHASVQPVLPCLRSTCAPMPLFNFCSHASIQPVLPCLYSTCASMSLPNLWFQVSAELVLSCLCSTCAPMTFQFVILCHLCIYASVTLVLPCLYSTCASMSLFNLGSDVSVQMSIHFAESRQTNYNLKKGQAAEFWVSLNYFWNDVQIVMDPQINTVFFFK